MITGESFCRKAFDKSKVEDYESYKSGWYDREKFGYNDNRQIDDLVKETDKKFNQIEEYVRTLYRDFNIDESDEYMCCFDPLSNIQCLMNHIRGSIDELARRRAGEQFLLF